MSKIVPALVASIIGLVVGMAVLEVVIAFVIKLLPYALGAAILMVTFRVAWKEYALWHERRRRRLRQ